MNGKNDGLAMQSCNGCCLGFWVIVALVVFASMCAGTGHASDLTDTAKAILHLDPDADMVYVDTLSSLIETEFTDEGCDPVFAVVLCWMESGFDPGAYNKDSGCAGLFQVHPCHGKQCSYDIEVNVAAGADIWSRYLERNDGDRYKALLRYGHKPKTARATLKLYEEIKDELE